VLLAERWSTTALVGKNIEAQSGIFFASMHPGWSDTDAVKNAMPEFYESQKSTLRTAEQGADTVVWLTASDKVNLKRDSGAFFEDRVSVSKHLWGCWTDSSKDDVDLLIAECERLCPQ
jgi:dehydrogenase/reductase SDR family protein 12